MEMLDTILKILNSKWFLLLGGIGMGLTIPLTWAATNLHPTAGNVVILILSVTGTFMFFYKFIEKWTTKSNPTQQQNW
jgi:hypothetical protein